MKAIITVMGNDKPGIIAAVSASLVDKNVNILDITQTTMQGIFTMIMLVDISGATLSVAELGSVLNVVGEKIGVVITIQHEDIFNSMHRI